MLTDPQAYGHLLLGACLIAGGLVLVVLTKSWAPDVGVTSVPTSSDQPLTRYCDERLLPTAADSLLDTASALWDVEALSSRGGGVPIV